jgi:hypothetical protein
VTSTTTSHTIGEPAQKSQTILAPPFCHGVSAITSALVFLVSARVPLWNGFRFHPKGWSFEIVLPLTVKGKIEIEASGARRKGPLTSFTGIAVCRSFVTIRRGKFPSPRSTRHDRSFSQRLSTVSFARPSERCEFRGEGDTTNRVSRDGHDTRSDG